jgi:ABC-type iron transport system FetAB ATPase subunit
MISAGIVLALRGVGYSFGDRRLFSGLDLELGEGEAVALCGPSGVGKTTLLRLVAGLLPLQEGELRFEGRSFDEVGPTHWRAELAHCVQGGPSMRGTPRELLERVAGLAVQRGRALDDAVALGAEWGLESARWERSFAELSTGERQRAQLALILAGRPRVLLLDEPTSALDGEARAAVEASLTGHTALWVTHDAQQAERVAARTIRLEA